MHTDVQYDAAVLHSCTDIIEAPVQTVYEVISDIRQWPAWQSATNRTQVQGVIRKGSEFKWHFSGMMFRAMIHTAQEPGEFGWVARSMWFKLVSNWTLEEHHGHTRLIIEESLSGLGAELLSGAIRNNLELTMLEVRKHAESLALVSV